VNGSTFKVKVRVEVEENCVNFKDDILENRVEAHECCYQEVFASNSL
jgi:hypothetical protein